MNKINKNSLKAVDEHLLKITVLNLLFDKLLKYHTKKKLKNFSDIWLLSKNLGCQLYFETKY